MATGNKRTLAFQVSEEFFAEVQEYIKRHQMTLKNFGITAMQRMLENAPAEPATEATDTKDAAPAATGEETTAEQE